MSGNSSADYENVLSTIELLNDSVIRYEGSLMDSIVDLAKNRQTEKIHETLILAERVKGFVEQINELKKSWVNIFNNKDNEVQPHLQMNEDQKDVTARTSWKITGDSIKIETERVEGPPYSNVIPVSIFKDIGLAAINFIDKNGFVKTSDVANLLNNKIITESDYKKAPRLPVYATFKVLIKEGVLKNDTHNTHKYLLGMPKSKAISWINSI